MCTHMVTMYMCWLTPITSSRCSNPVSYFEPLFWTLPRSSCPSNKDLQRIQLLRDISAVFGHTSHTQIQPTTRGHYPKAESSSYSKEPSSSLTMQMSDWMSYNPIMTITLRGIQALAKRLVISDTSSTGPDWSDSSPTMGGPAPLVAEANPSITSLSVPFDSFQLPYNLGIRFPWT